MGGDLHMYYQFLTNALFTFLNFFVKYNLLIEYVTLFWFTLLKVNVNHSFDSKRVCKVKF